MRKDEHVVMERRVRTPPAIPWSGCVPRTWMPTEHVASHDGGADIRHRLLDDRSAFVHPPAGQAVLFAPGRKRKPPFVQPHAALSQRILHTLIRSRDESVEGR